jgi:hypothetical protein
MFYFSPVVKIEYLVIVRFPSHTLNCFEQCPRARVVLDQADDDTMTRYIDMSRDLYSGVPFQNVGFG